MCDVKGGCTCGNEYCDDDFDVAAMAPKVSVEEVSGRKIFTVDVGDLPPEEVIKFVDRVKSAFTE